ncbi:MAG: S49 family peptidase [Alphaproteobacteria bacterium]|nr:S49 family peptidase [Alphaproteobacteria bacterium]
MKLHRPTVAVLPLAGVIGVPGRSGSRTLTYESVVPGIERAFGYRRLAAVALSINSPGGSPVQSARIADRIRTLGEEKGVPVLSFVDDVGASGGYWLACAGSEVFVHPASILGSIGVIFAGFGLDGALRRLGIERRVHAIGARKGMLDPFQPEKVEDVETLRAMQEDIHKVFIEWIRERRGARLKEEDDDLFSGKVWTGRQAVELGLADGFGEMEQVVRERFGKRVRLRTALRRRRRLPLPLALPGLADAVEERLLWARYGL